MKNMNSQNKDKNNEQQDKEKAIAQTAEPTPSPRKPLHVIRCGSVSARIWPNTNVDDPVTQITRTYVQEEQWKSTNRFYTRDLQKVEIVARRAFEWLSLREEDPEQESQRFSEENEEASREPAKNAEGTSGGDTQ